MGVLAEWDQPIRRFASGGVVSHLSCPQSIGRGYQEQDRERDRLSGGPSSPKRKGIPGFSGPDDL